MKTKQELFKLNNNVIRERGPIIQKVIGGYNCKVACGFIGVQ